MAQHSLKKDPAGATTGPAPTVAVVIATYNRAHVIKATIDSILAQTRPADELIVVDDGSTDDTPTVVGGYGNRVCYRKKENGGKSSALNLVIPTIRSDFVCFFDDDDIMLPAALKTHLQFLAEHLEYDFSYSPNYVFAESAAIEAITSRPPRPLPEVASERFFLWMMEAPFLPTPMQGMLIPTRCFEIAGLFDTRLARSQDRDMVIRIARHFRAGRIDAPLWALRQHAGVRGPAHESHNATSRYAIWWRYKHLIFTKLRDTLAISEYIPADGAPAAEARGHEARVERRGLLQRGVIMAIHGLFDEAVIDFDAYCRLERDGSYPADGHELWQISRLAHSHASEMMPPEAFYRALGARCRGRGALLRACLRGLYWSARRDFQNKRFASCLRITKAAVLVVGTARRRLSPNRSLSR